MLRKMQKREQRDGSSGEPEDAAELTARTDDSRTSGAAPDHDK